MTFATNMIATARTLLLRYGQVVNFSRTVEGAYNPATSEATDTAPTTFSGYGHPEPYASFEVDNATILSTDIKLLTYVTTLPLVGDTVTLDSIAYRVENVMKVRAQGSDIVYQLQLRV